MAEPGRLAAARTVTAVALVAVTLAVRLGAMAGQGLWADEFFSLAMATGHSLEHLPQMAVAELGDYVEPATPLPAAEIARYLEHDDPPAGLGRVARAVRLSDTSPPLYYVLLNLWTRVWGTSGAALRAFSLLAALAAMPVLAALARRLGGRRAVVPALALYALAPLSVHFSTEGRMYALLWTIASGQVLVSLRLRRRRAARWPTWLGWIALGVAGLLTHFYYLFLVVPLTIWLLAQPGRVPTRRLVIAAALASIAAAPWYLEALAMAQQWRVTAGWLDGRPRLGALAMAPLHSAASFISGLGSWGGSRTIEPLLLGFFAMLAVVGLGTPRRRRARVVGGLWLLAACLGPAAFDLLQDAETALHPRYALIGLPAAMLLAASALTALPVVARRAVLAAVLVLWLPALREITTSELRGQEPYLEVARELDRRLDARSLIVIRSAPASAAGLARSLAGPTPVLPRTQATWLRGVRFVTPTAELEAAARRKARVALVEIHVGDDAGSVESWLQRRSRQCEDWSPRTGNARIVDCKR